MGRSYARILRGHSATSGIPPPSESSDLDDIHRRSSYASKKANQSAAALLPIAARRLPLLFCSILVFSGFSIDSPFPENLFPVMVNTGSEVVKS
jgi:hypothetical protein